MAYDREDQAAAAKAGARTKKVRKIVRKKKPPIPVPSIEATWRQPAPKVKPTPMQPVGPEKKKKPRPGHLPTQYEYLSAEQLINRNLGVETKAEKRDAQRFNQQKERSRRDLLAAQKAARKEAAAEERERRAAMKAASARASRIAHLRRLLKQGTSPFDLEGSNHLGRNQSLEDFVENGKIDRAKKPGFWDYVKAVAPELDDGFDDIDNWAWRAARRVPEGVTKAGELDDFTDDVGHGVKRYGRWGQGQKEQFKDAADSGGFAERVARITLEATDWVDTTIEWGIGSETHKMLRGEAYNPAMLGAEASLLFLPVKGLPSLGSVALRKAFGLGAKEGLWGSERGSMAMGEAFSKLGFDPDGKFIAFLKNDPHAKRWFRNGDAAIWVEPARSRVGRGAERVADWARPVLSVGPRLDVPKKGKPQRVSIFKNEGEKWADGVAAQHQEAWRNAMHHTVLLSQLVGRHMGNLFKGLPSHEYYALRMAGKGQGPDELIDQFSREAAEATAKGDYGAAARLERHVSQIEKARPLVTITDTAIRLNDNASPALKEILDVLESGAVNREEILERAGMLTADNAQARVTAEQLWAYGARYQPTEQFISQTMQDSPNRKKLVDIALARANGDEDAAGAVMDMVDAMARKAMNEAIQKIAKQVSALEQEVLTSRDPQKAVDLQRLKSDLARGIDPDTFYGAWNETLGDFPQELKDRFGEGTVMSLIDIGNPFAFGPRKEKTNLVRRLKINAYALRHRNRPRLDDNGIPVVGKISMDDRTKRLELATLTPEQRLHDARFYSNVEPLFARVFNDEEIMAWLASQVGASPARGVLDLMKVMDAVREGRDIPSSGPGSIGLAAHAMRDILAGKTSLSRGAQAKISDFIDSALHKTTRTWVGDDPAGGRPFVADRWSARAEGLVDRQGVKQIAERWGFTRLNLDLKGDGLSETQYEQVAKGGEDFTDHLNSISFDGRNDWEPYEIQAMEWAAIQRYWGVEPEDIAYALDANTKMLAFEVTRGPGDLGADLTDAQTKKVAKSMEDSIVRILSDDPATRLHDVRIDLGGWSGGTNGAVYVHLIAATEENALVAASRIARAFDQEMVQMTRRTTSGNGVRRSITLHGSALKSAATKKKFMKALYEELPEIQTNGWMADVFQGSPAITVVTSRGKVVGKQLDEWAESIGPAIDRAEAKTGLTLEWVAGNHKIRVGGQHGEVPVTAESGTVGGLGRDDLADPVEAEVRGRLEAAIAAARRGDDYASRAEFDVEAAEKTIRGLQKEIDAAIKQRAHELGGTDSFQPTGGKITRSNREWEPGIGRRGAIGGRPGDYIDDQTTRVEKPYKTGWQNAKDAAEWELIREGGDIARKMDELDELQKQLREATYPDWALFSKGEDEVSMHEAERGKALIQDIPGYAEAMQQLENGTVPVDWLKALVKGADDADMHKYERWRIGSHLSQVSQRGGGPSLYGSNWKSVPGLAPFFTRTKLRGVYQPSIKRLIVGSKGGLPTILHELTHMSRIEGLLPEQFISDVEAFLNVSGDWTEKNHEDFASMVDAAFLGMKDDMDVPDHIRLPLTRVRDEYVKEAASGDQKAAAEMLDRLPEGMQRDVLETLVFFARSSRREAGFHGASKDFRLRRGFYMPEVRALPTTIGRAAQTIRAYSRQTGRASGQAANITPADAATTHRFKADLARTGAFDENILKGSVAAQRVAANVWAFFHTHAEAVKIGNPLPSSTDDLAIPVVPGTRITGEASKRIDFLSDLFDSLGGGRKLTMQDIEGLDAETMEAARDVLFHGSTKQTEKATAQLAEELMMTQEPLEGVVWVNRDDLLNTGLFELPNQRGMVGTLAGAINDYLKATVLVLKPSYIPMNLVGNTAMLLMQQGAYAPINLIRSFALHSAIGDYAALIDFHAGTGHMKAVYGSQGGIPILSKGLDKVTDASGVIVDRYPRRAAFLHEATKLGYRTDEDIIRLLTSTDQAVLDDLRIAGKRTRNAMVDFDNLSSFEKNVLTRLIFVYPWLKGATYWTARFPKDHPVQAMAYAYLMAQQQDRLQEKFPDGYPGYMKWYLPYGQTTRDGEEHPYGLRLDQALTFLTPADIASDVWGMTVGQGTGLLEGETEPASSHLGPIYEILINNLQGYDAFTGQPKEGGLAGMLKDMLPWERMVVVDQIKRILRSDEQRLKNPGIYPTSRGEDWLKLLFGSLAPGPIDSEVAAERAAGHRPADEASLKLYEAKLRDRLEATPAQVEAISKLYLNDKKYGDFYSDLKREEGLQYSTPQLKAAALVATLLDGAGKELSDRKKDAIMALDDETAEQIVEEAWARLGLGKLSKINTALEDVGRARENGS